MREVLVVNVLADLQNDAIARQFLYPRTVQRETVKDDPSQTDDSATVAAPGVVIVFSGNEPCFHVVALRKGSLDLGRDDLAALHVTDNRVSRDHLRLRFADGLWTITDRGSTNGVCLDGTQLDAPRTTPDPRVIRIGKTLVLPLPDISLHALHGMSVKPDRIVGPQLRVALDKIAAMARANQNVLLHGGTGTGKEIAARVFHEAQTRKTIGERPFVAVNCATIPAGLAERILFGAKRGAYSGADADANGLVQAAHGGTLFLDEIGDIDSLVQAKLLRVIETKEVLPIGALQPVSVDFSLCAATHKDLRIDVQAGRFREDLYFRIGRPETTLPSLFDRPEEIPWLVQRAIAAVHPQARPDVEFIEQCLLRPWPGNVRELLAEARAAALAALGQTTVSARHLAKTAGIALDSPPPSDDVVHDADDHPITHALREAGGNVSRASSLLGMTRAKVRRYIDKTGIDVTTLRKK